MASGEETATATKIPVPTSLTSNHDSLPPLTSHLLTSHLRQTGSLADLSVLLTDSLSRTGWTDRVRALALELLRNGTCNTFPDLLEEVLRRTKLAKTEDSKGGATGGKSVPNGTTGNQAGAGPTSAPGSQVTGASGPNGAGSIMVRDGWFGSDGLPDVRIPAQAVTVGVDFLKERITDLVEPVEDD